MFGKGLTNFVLLSVENIVGKGGNAGYQHFLLFPQCFQKDSLSGSLKAGIVWERFENLSLRHIEDFLLNNKIFAMTKLKEFEVNTITLLNSLANDKSFDQSKLKAFADNNKKKCD